jgi:hypothetical protein
VTGLGHRDGDALSNKPMGGHLMVTTSLRQGLSMVLQASLPADHSLRLAPHPTAARAGRDFVRRTLLDLRLSRHITAASLIVSGLVSNAVMNSGTDIDLTVYEHRQALRIAVRDHGADLPFERVDTAGDDEGQRLAIVARHSSAWGVLPHAGGGKVFWAVIAASPRMTQMTSRSPAAPTSRHDGPMSVRELARVTSRR